MLFFFFRAGCITSAARSLDILRQNLQKSINNDIQEVLKKYIDVSISSRIVNMDLVWQVYIPLSCMASVYSLMIKERLSHKG